MIDRLGDFLTFEPWGWYALLLVVLVGLLWLANWYEDHRLPRARRALSDAEVERALRPSPAPVDVMHEERR